MILNRFSSVVASRGIITPFQGSPSVFGQCANVPDISGVPLLMFYRDAVFHTLYTPVWKNFVYLSRNAGMLDAETHICGISGKIRIR